MSAVLAALPDRQPSPFNPSPPAAERERTLLAALPEPLQAALSQGTTARRSRFTEDGFDEVRENWTPPATVSPTQAAMARRALDEMRRGPLAPAPPDRLLARVLALLSHYPAKGLSPDVEQLVALDWAEDLGEFPAWAVDQAARVWRRTRKWRPSIAEIRALCQDACKGERALAERLALLTSTVAASGATGMENAAADRVRPLTAALRRMP